MRFSAAVAVLSLCLQAQAQASNLMCWEVKSIVIPCDGADHGAEFGVGLPNAIPSWVPNPLRITEMHLTYYEFPGGPTVPLPENVYGAMSANTDIGRAWLGQGCDVNNQNCSENGVDLGKLFIRYRNSRPYAQFKYSHPVLVRDTDGLVMSQVCYGGGEVQAIWDFCWEEQ